MLIAGGAGLAVVVAIAVVAVLVTQKPSPTPASKSGIPAAAPSAGAPSAAAPTPSVDLNSILLNPTDINTVMGASNIQPKSQDEQMGVPPGTLSNPECLGALQPIQGPAYQDSGYTAVRGQALSAEDPAHFVHEAAVSFPSAEQALGFVRTSADKWQACVGQLLTVTTPNKIFHWNFAKPTGAPPNIAQVHTQLHGGRTCQHTLSAVSNVVIDVVACGAQIADEGSRIAEQMAAKVTP